MGVERADAADKLKVHVAGELRRVHGVEVVEHGAISDARTGAADGICAGRAACPPEHFGSDAEVVIEENIAANARIGTAAKGREVFNSIHETGSWGYHRANAESDINFLRLREIRACRHGGTGEREQDGKTHCLFQRKPPFEVLGSKRWMQISGTTLLG
jgi:hypothetical protein